LRFGLFAEAQLRRQDFPISSCSYQRARAL
jgi:hypothetical protein